MNQNRADAHVRRRMRFALLYARFLRQWARGLLALSRPLPQGMRVRAEMGARLLRNLAVLSVQPKAVRRMTERPFILKSMLDGAGLGALAGFAGAYLLDGPLFLTIPGIVAIVLILGIFVSLTSFLSLSGDLYLETRDELQQLVVFQASAYTLRLTTILLVLIIIACTFIRPLRDSTSALLCLVLVAARLVYLVQLARLRWRELADIDLMEDEYIEDDGFNQSLVKQ